MSQAIKMRCVPGRTLLTPRDIGILSYAACHRFITANEVKLRFWGASSLESNHHYTRLRALCRLGLLEPVQGDNLKALGYRITRKGIGYLPSEALKSRALLIRRTSYRTGFDHDRLLNGIQDVFEKSPLVSDYRGEHEVRSLLVSRHGKKENRQEQFKVPDGLFRLTTPRNSMMVAIELELSVKSETRYRQILRALLKSPDFQAVFYLVKNDEIKKLLQRILADVKANDLVIQTSSRLNAIYFATLEGVLETQLDAPFEGENVSFTMNSLAKP